MKPRSLHPCPGVPSGIQPQLRQRRTAASAFLLLFTVFSLSASIYVQQMTLESLCAKANRVIRGTVLKATAGQIRAGGGTLPTVTYQIQVKDSFNGSTGDVVNLTMITEPKAELASGNARRFPILELPPLEEGKDYLLFTTKPSKAGLTSPVGLAQGCFSISKKGETDVAVNGVNNAGLGLSKDGPIEYEELARRIRALRGN